MLYVVSALTAYGHTQACELTFSHACDCMLLSGEHAAVIILSLICLRHATLPFSLVFLLTAHSLILDSNVLRRTAFPLTTTKPRRESIQLLTVAFRQVGYRTSFQYLSY